MTDATASAATAGRMLRIAAAAAFAGLVAACSSPSEDPRAGGLAGGIQGIATGGYEKRLDERRQTIAGLDASAARLEGRLAERTAAVAGIDQSIAQRRAALARAEGDLANVDQRLRQLRQSQSGGLAELETLARKRDEIRALMEEAQRRLAEDAEISGRAGEARAAAGRAAETDRRLQQINARLRALKTEVDALNL
jgi:chromosome segregation ATPase